MQLWLHAAELMWSGCGLGFCLWFLCLFNETCPACGSVCLGDGIGVDVGGWCVAVIKVFNSGGGYCCCSFCVNRFWMGFCIVIWMGGSNYGTGLLDLGVWLVDPSWFDWPWGTVIDFGIFWCFFLCSVYNVAMFGSWYFLLKDGCGRFMILCITRWSLERHCEGPICCVVGYIVSRSRRPVGGRE